MDVEALKHVFSTLPAEVIGIVVFATLITVVTLRMGASISIAFSIALLVANMLFAAIPGTFMLGAALAGVTNAYASIGIYAALTLVLTFVLYRMTSTLADDSARPLFALATALATTVIALTVWQMAPHLESVWKFNEMIRGAFGAAYRLYWILLAFVAFAFVKS